MTKVEEASRSSGTVAANKFIRSPFNYSKSYNDDTGKSEPKQPQTNEDIMKLGEKEDECKYIITIAMRNVEFNKFKFLVMRDPRAESLKDHLLYRGVHFGFLSDVTLNISNEKHFKLHRFILAQSPILRSHFEEIEFDADQVVFMDMLDDFVTLEAIEHIFNRLYGNLGDHYYECKNLVPLMAVCVQFGLLTWLYEYLDRAFARLSAESFLHLVFFSQDPVYQHLVEPQIRSMVIQYMIRCGTDIHITVWSRLPMEWVLSIITDDGFVYGGPNINDVQHDIGFCHVMTGEEFARWTFARDLYYDRLGLTEEVLIYAEQEGSVPTHIDQNLLEEVAPLFKLLNSSAFHYCNMNTTQWRQIRRETFLGTSLLIRPDLIADNIFEGVYLRKYVEDADPGSSSLGICYMGGTNIPDPVSKFSVPRESKFVYIPKRPESDEPAATERESRQTAVPDAVKNQFSTLPPIRFSVVFNFSQGIGSVPLGVAVPAEPVFYAGSWWEFSIQRTRDTNEPADRIQMNIKRIATPEASLRSKSSKKTFTAFSEINYEEFTREALQGRYDPKFLDEFLDRESPAEFYPDHRQNVKAYFRIYASSALAGYDPEKAVIMEGRMFPKIRCPAIARTTIYESEPVDFCVNAPHCIPGRLLLHAVEEAQEIKEFIDDSSYFKHEVDKILTGEPISLQRSSNRDIITAYQHTGEVSNEEEIQPGDADKGVVQALTERASIWTSMRFSIVIGVV